MKYALATIVLLAGGAWLGAMLMTAASVIYFFVTDRDLAVQFGPRVFHVFDAFQVTCGLLTVAAAVSWRLRLCSAPKRWMTRLLILAAILGAFSTVVVTPRITSMWYSGQSRTPEFRKWHGVSQTVNLVQLLTLMAGLSMVPWALRHDARREIAATAAAV